MKSDEVLKLYGLTNKETTIYLTLLTLGSVNLQEIARRVDFPRTTVYNTLNYLLEKGLVSKIIKKGITFFEAADPKKLLEKLDLRRKLVQSILPELESLKSIIKESSSAEIYEGKKGLFTVLSDVFNKKQQTYCFGSYSSSIEVLKHQPEHFARLRLERKIPAKIVIDSYDEKRFHEKEYKKITEIKFHKGLKDFPCMIFIYGNKVAMYTLKGDLIGIIIRNEQVAKAMKLIFDLYWISANASIQRNTAPAGI